LAAEFGYAVIPPYDDPAIIAGQATCGLEIVEQLGLVGEFAGAQAESGRQKGPNGTDELNVSGSYDFGAEAPALRMTGGQGGVVVLSPVSGGGLLSGVATAVKLATADAGIQGASVQLWGAEPELAADAKESFDTRTLVEWPAAKTSRTISDGLRTQSVGVLNFAHILRYVDGIVTVSEEEILTAMRVMLAATGIVPEPSGAVTLAAALFHFAELPRCERMVAVVSGGNIEPELREKLERGSAAAI
jgi:threonine dehydratase